MSVRFVGGTDDRLIFNCLEEEMLTIIIAISQCVGPLKGLRLLMVRLMAESRGSVRRFFMV